MGILTDFDKRPEEYVPKDVNDPDKRSPYLRGKELAQMQGRDFNPCEFCKQDGNAENPDVLDHRKLCKHYIGMGVPGQTTKETLKDYFPLVKRLEIDMPENEAAFDYLSGKSIPIPDNAASVWVAQAASEVATATTVRARETTRFMRLRA